VSGVSVAPSGQADEEGLIGCNLGGGMEEGIQLVVASSASVRLLLFFLFAFQVVTCATFSDIISLRRCHPFTYLLPKLTRI
jgi:hypothetical protein